MKRTVTFGFAYSPTWVNRFGLWLSSRRIRSAVRDFRELGVADIDCGYNALFARRRPAN